MTSLSIATRLGLLALAFTKIHAESPVSPERNLSLLQTSDVALRHSLVTRFEHRFEEPIAPAGENNPFYNMLGMDGGANIYFDLSFALGSRSEITLAREREFKTYGLEGKWQAWQQSEDASPLSVAVTANVQVRTEKNLADNRRFSTGGSLILSRFFYGQNLEAFFNALGQSNTLVETMQGDPDHSLAAGLGLIWRLDRLSFFAEGIVPLKFGDFGYRRTYGGRAPHGLPLQGYGFNYRVGNHGFAMTVTNYTTLLAANALAGAHAPGAERLMEWRLGFNLTRSFSLRNAESH